MTNARVSNSTMTQDIQKDGKNGEQNFKAKAERAKDHAEGKPSSETLNRAQVRANDAAEDVKRDLGSPLFVILKKQRYIAKATELTEMAIRNTIKITIP